MNTLTKDYLQSQITKIINSTNGGYELQFYIITVIFYRFLSDNIIKKFYSQIIDKTINEKDIDNAVREIGYFIKPNQLFDNVINNYQSINEIRDIFNDIEKSSDGNEEYILHGLFDGFDINDNKLGATLQEKEFCIKKIFEGVANLDFNNLDCDIDVLGTIYECFLSNKNASSGGEFYTPACVSNLLSQLVLLNQNDITKVYDPTCGSGGLLLAFSKQKHDIQYYGQEINETSCKLAKMNMLINGVDYIDFNIALGNTLLNPAFDDIQFDAIVSNPPYSVKWIGDNDPNLIYDKRFAPVGVLAPKSKADFAFVLHALNYLSTKGRAAIVCFPGIFYRGGAEQRIRQYLIDNNYIESVISLAANLFFGTSIAVNILVLSKHKTDNRTQFIDASSLYKKETNNSILTEEHIAQIMAAFADKKDIPHFSKSVELAKIKANNYGLAVSTYVAAKDERETIDIEALNAEIKAIRAKKKPISR